MKTGIICKRCHKEVNSVKYGTYFCVSCQNKYEFLNGVSFTGFPEWYSLMYKFFGEIIKRLLSKLETLKRKGKEISFNPQTAFYAKDTVYIKGYGKESAARVDELLRRVPLNLKKDGTYDVGRRCENGTIAEREPNY